MWLQVVCCINTITWIKLLFSCLSKVLVPVYRNTWYHIAEDHTLHTDLHKNLQSHVVFIMRVTKFWFAPSSTMLHCITPCLLYRSAHLHMARNCFTPRCSAQHCTVCLCTTLLYISPHVRQLVCTTPYCTASQMGLCTGEFWRLPHWIQSVILCQWVLEFLKSKTTLQINIQQKSCSPLQTAEWNHSDQHVDHKDNRN